MNSGIYTITNITDNKMYVGYTKNLVTRKAQHYCSLRHNNHKNYHLQNAWNLYGENNFIYDVLETCDLEYLASFELYWINSLNTLNEKFGYNLKLPNPTTQGKHSESTRQKLCVKAQRPRSETQLLGQKKRRKPVDQYTVDGKFVKSWTSTQEAGQFLNKNHKNIIDAAYGKSHTAYGYRWVYKKQSLKPLGKRWRQILEQNPVKL